MTLGWLLCRRVRVDVVGVGVWLCRLFYAVRDDADVGFVCVSIGLCGASLCSGFVVHGVLHNFKLVMMLG